jgi:hypothetical protein
LFIDFCFVCNFWWVLFADPVTVRSKAWHGSRVRSPLGAWMFVFGLSMLCCPVHVQALRRDDRSSRKSVLKYVVKCD